MPVTSKHDKSENELRHYFLFPCPSIPGLLMWLTSFPFLFVWGSRRERSFPSGGRIASQARCGQGRLSLLGSSCSGLKISQWAHGNTGPSLAQPDQFVHWLSGWSAGLLLEAQPGFKKSADVAVIDPPGWVLSWSPVWLSWISYRNCMSCACLACGLGQMNQ